MEEIQSELKEIRRILKDVNNQMQELREGLRRTSFPAPMLPMPQPYEHPWWKHQWPGSQPCGNNLGGQVQASGSNNFDETRFRISGTTKAA
jgi:hypothetical protein